MTALALAERSASELAALRKLATELAHARKERATSVHLLAAIADRPGQAADLLRERGLDRDGLLKAGRSFDEDGPDAMLRALAEAREVQKRVRTPLPTDRVRPAGPAQLSPDSRHVLTEPTGLHLLIALLGERRFAACRALATIGVDLARLRASSVQQALGLVAARRIPARMLEVPQAATPSAAPPRPTGVAVPLLPPVPRAPRPTTTTPATPVATAVPPPRLTRAVRPAPMRPPSGRPATRESAPPPSTPEALKDRAPSSSASTPPKTSLDPATFPLLAALGRDLVEASRAGELAPVIGREVEIERVLDVLAKLRANVPVLIGPPGVGKTAVVHGLAERFARGPLRSRKKLIEIGVPDLVAGTGTRGALAERLARLRTEITRADGDVVIFVDEIHELFAGGAADEASAELRVALARGELPLLGATTGESFKKAVEADPTLARRVVAIEVEEPNAEDAFLQVRGASARLADHHRLAFDEEAIAAAIGWSVRYLPGRALPDKALALLDLAGARRKRVLDDGEGPFVQGGSASSKPGSKTSDGRRLRMEDVAPVVAEQASIPVERLLETDADRMLALEKTLGERVVGRAEPLARIATLLRRNAVGLRGRRPIGTFLLLGPTGVGKTETAKAIAEALFDSPDAMTRLDLSEFAEAHAIAKLIGAPPGYVGHEAGGQLTEALRKRPYQVILLDEVEKAHRDVLQAFLQVFDEGRMTDGRGRLVDFTNTVIVMTSNLGVAELRHVRDRRGIGFGGHASTSATVLEDAVVGAAKKALAPELFNRIDEVVFYPPLERAQIAEIARKLLEEVGDRLADKGVAMQVDDDGIEALLAAGGYDPELGARPMRRAIGRLVEAPIAERLLRRELPPGATVIVGADDDGKVAIDAVLPS